MGFVCIWGTVCRVENAVDFHSILVQPLNLSFEGKLHHPASYSPLLLVNPADLHPRHSANRPSLGIVHG